MEKLTFVFSLFVSLSLTHIFRQTRNVFNIILWRLLHLLRPSLFYLQHSWADGLGKVGLSVDLVTVRDEALRQEVVHVFKLFKDERLQSLNFRFQRRKGQLIWGISSWRVILVLTSVFFVGSDRRRSLSEADPDQGLLFALQQVESLLRLRTQLCDGRRGPKVIQCLGVGQNNFENCDGNLTCGVLEGENILLSFKSGWSVDETALTAFSDVGGGAEKMK